MNTDDKIRAILHEQAEAVDPSPAGWDAITSGIAVRRRRVWWLRGGALAGAALAAATAVAYVARDDSNHAIQQVPATSTPSPSETFVDEPIGAVWPLTTTSDVRAWQNDESSDPDLREPGQAALEFGTKYLGIADANAVPTADRLRWDISRPVNGRLHVVTTVTLAGFADGGRAPYVVVRATSPAVTIDDPASGATVSSPLAAHGTYVTVDPSFTVRLRTGLDDLATAHATTGPPSDWDATLPFVTTAGTGSVLITNGGTVDSGIDAAAAVPVTFGAPAAPATTRPSVTP